MKNANQDGMISIVVPVYNSDNYLYRCVEHILCQSNTNWELILVDDGSKDNSGVICDQLKSMDSRIRVIHQDNCGASIARQVGIVESCGECITFVDSDDVVEPDYLEILYNALLEKGTEISACDFIKHQEGEAVTIVRCSESVILESDELHQRFFKYDFWGYPGKMYRRDVFDGLYFPQATINEDYVVMAQVFQKCQRMAYVPAGLYHYMMHNGSLSNQSLNIRMMDEWINKRWVVSYYKGIESSKWCDFAIAQAAETCCKLIDAISRKNKPREYIDIYHEMQLFLRSHLFSLLCSKKLLLGLKIMCIKRAFE